MMRSYAQLISKHSICSFQDKGREGFRHWGVPVSGPMDIRAWELANALAGNDGNEAVLEIGMPALSLRFSAPAYLGVVTGNDVIKLNGQVVPYSQFPVSKGDVIEFSHSHHLHFRYMAIRGGWQSPVVLNSRCTYPSLGLPLLQQGSVLPYHVQENLGENHAQTAVSYAPVATNIPVLPGPDFHFLEVDKIQIFLKNMTLHRQLTRQAFGLMEQYPVAEYPATFHSVSCVPGIIQLTPSGHFYVLMRDAQTTGGYLQVLYIPSTFLPVLAQASPGSKISFTLQ